MRIDILSQDYTVATVSDILTSRRLEARIPRHLQRGVQSCDVLPQSTSSCDYDPEKNIADSAAERKGFP